MTGLFISRFSSLSFEPYRHHFETNVCYLQKFIASDVIRVQLNVLNASGVKAILTNLSTNRTQNITINNISSTLDYTFKEFTITALSQGNYKLTLLNLFGEVIAETMFCVISQSEAINTILLKYRNYRSEFDADFANDRYFDFRIEGGFLYGEMDFDSDYESFRDQRYGLNPLSAYPYENHTLTIGSAKGVPVWAAQKLNLIFSLSETTINGITYVRGEGAKPEVTQLSPKYPLYVYKIDVEPLNTYSTEKDSFPNGLNVLGSSTTQAIAFEDNILIIQ